MSPELIYSKTLFPLSIAAWIKPINENAQFISNDATLDAYYGAWLQFAGTPVIRICVGNGGAPGSGSRACKDYSQELIGRFAWHHVVGIFRGLTDMGIYLDGDDVVGTYSGTGNAFVYNGTSGAIGMRDFVVGGRNELYGSGITDDVRVYNRALTAAEIKRLYNMGR